MKTKVEINGYEITIEENEGVITVKAEKEGDIVEEFSLDSSEEGYEDEKSKGKGEGIKSFGEFGKEEDDFEEEEDDEEEIDEEDDDEEYDDEEEIDEEEDDEEDNNEKTLESFQSFINKRKK